MYEFMYSEISFGFWLCAIVLGTFLVGEKDRKINEVA
jgi:hypothetical protein